MENNPIESLINSPITEGPIMEDVRHGEEGYVDMKAKMATKDLTVSYAKVQALKGVSLNIYPNEVTALIGPSGCGKSTFIRSLNRMNDTISVCNIEGQVFLDGENIYDPARDVVQLRTQVGMVFQKPNPFPKSIFENVAYGPKIHGLAADDEELRGIVLGSLERAGLLDEVKDRLNVPGTSLSGGQQQRASLARAIVSNPLLLLFDEPLSNLDLKLREQMRVELKRIQNEVGITSIYVTHDQSEALVMSDEIIVMSKGRIEQRDVPLSVYSKPANGYVSQFIGVANLIEGTLAKKNKSGTGVADLNKTIKGLTCDCVLSSELESGDDVLVSIRPENISVSKKNIGGKGIKGKVDLAIFLGNCVDCRISSDGFEWKVLSHPRENLQEGDSVFLHLDPKHTLAVTP